MEELASEEEPPGGTPLFKASRLGKNLHMNNLFIKFEGANTTGTQKDRISRLHVSRAIEMGYDTISLATCGNYGASVSYYASIKGIESVIGMPDSYAMTRLADISSHGGTVMKLPGRYEDVVAFMSEQSRSNGWYDSNPGAGNSELDMLGYESIAYEIFEQLGHSPNYVAVPVGNGTTLAGIYSGFRKLKSRGEIETLPSMIGSSTSTGNPVVSAWIRGSEKVMDLEPESIIETGINEPLVAYRSLDGQKALTAIRESGGMAAYVSDSEMLRYSSVVDKDEGLSVLPASASAIAAVHSLLGGCCINSEVVIVLTGRNQI